MPRSRNIKPAFFTDDILAEASVAARLLFIGLWTLADWQGNLEYRPKRIKAGIFPYDGDYLDVKPLLDELTAVDSIRYYTGSRSGQDRVFINIRKFYPHQNPHKKERDIPCEIPDYDAEGTQRLDNRPDYQIPGVDPEIPGLSALIPDSCSLIPDVLIPVSLQKSDNENSDVPETVSEPPKGVKIQAKGHKDSKFEEWWLQYPKKVGKKTCKEIWKRRKLDTIADTIIADTIKRPTACRKWKEGFITNPSTYLNGDRWEDAYDDDQQQKKSRFDQTVEDTMALMEAQLAPDETIPDSAIIEGELDDEWYR